MMTGQNGIPGRWGRLADDLAAVGIQVYVDEQPYTESAYGRTRSGVSRSITILLPDHAGTVEVRDAWWHKNPDKWVGWEVTRADAGGIDRDRAPRTKKRAEVVAAVTRMLPGRP